MTHFIQCIIGPKSSISALSAKWIHAKKIDLNADFSLIPLTQQLLEDINELVGEGENLAYKEFELLSKSVEAILKENSYNKPIGYIETDYRAGQGTQVGIAYFSGKIIEGPIVTKTIWDENELKFVAQPKGKGAINTILYKLGLEERKDIDGFDNLALAFASWRKKMKIG